MDRGQWAGLQLDQVWDSEASLTDEGWMAMFAIPFRSLRFRPGVQNWGVVLGRSFPRNSENDNWPHISSNITGMLPQEGTLQGIEGVDRIAQPADRSLYLGAE